MLLNPRNFNSARAAIGRRKGIGPVLRAARDFHQQIAQDPSLAAFAQVDAGQIDAGQVFEQVAPERWTPTKRHRATRRIGFRSKRSFRVSLVDERLQEVRAESLLEAWLILVLLAMPMVVDVIEQPPCVWYLNDEGKWVRHWFDCVAVFADGRRIAYVVKPRRLAERQGTKRLVELLARYVDAGMADSVMHVDEDCLSRDDVYNAELINSVRLHGPFRDDAAVAAVEALVRRPMLLDEVVLRAGHGGQGYRAIARLIADGVLRVARGDVIDYGSVIEPVGNGRTVH